MRSKLIFSAFVLSSVLFLTACGNNDAKTSTEKMAKEATESNEEKDLTGTFTANGKTYTGRVSVQHFPATNQFSVLCQDDTDPNASKLIQFVFKDEASARAGGTFTTAYDQGKNQADNEASLTFEISYNSSEDSKGTCTISKNGSDNEVVFDNVKLQKMSKESITVSGKIPF